MYHYYGTAKSNYMEFLQGDEVNYKKYFYVIRPLIAAKEDDRRADWNLLDKIFLDTVGY